MFPFRLVVKNINICRAFDLPYRQWSLFVEMTLLHDDFGCLLLFEKWEMEKKGKKQTISWGSKELISLMIL